MPRLAIASDTAVPEAVFHIACIQVAAPRALMNLFMLVNLEAACAKQLAAVLDDGFITVAIGAMCG